ncbi:hypothetical protein [Paenibacillus ginsengarvi]|uniref:FTP domain-containing protein n=1 Tax=Paenibacillus ginsengarvi TaxID=400777 RepID=A0A3B0BZB8_9BACL|nr:hypothetical protein [Paenibacillus ginsengarvi]RKN78260.1 hypothetical protein D7M11_23420 [Paenibacillus ginsengarvi]
MWESKWIWVTALALAWMEPHLSSEAGAAYGPAARFIQKLEKESGHTLRMSWNADTGTPGTLEGRLSKPSRHTPEWITLEFAEAAKSLYGLKQVRENMKVAHVEHRDTGTVAVRLQRYLYGRPVCGDSLTAELDASRVIRRVEGTIHADLERKRLRRPMFPALSAREAAAAAAAYAQNPDAAGTARVEACYLPTREGVPLVYIVSLPPDTSYAASPRIVTVHSLTGRVIDGY